MGNKDVGQVESVFQTIDQIQHLCPYRHIQSAHRLIADHQLGMGCQRPGNSDSLALTAGKFMGKSAEIAAVNAHHIHQTVDLLQLCLTGKLRLKQLQRLPDLLSHRHTGIE